MDIGLAYIKHNHSKDFFGVPIDVRKSDVQKAIRRGMFSQACGSFFAGYNLRGLFPDNSTALGIQTNFINRLMVIAVEDVGFANPMLVCTLLPVLNEMSKNNMARDPSILVSIIHALAISPKSRLCSHLASVYRKEKRGIAMEHGIVFVDEPTLNIPDCFTWLETKPPDEVFILISKNKACLPYKADFELLKKVYSKASKTFGQPAFIRYILGLAHFLNMDSVQGEFVRNEMSQSREGMITSCDLELLNKYLTHDPSRFSDPLPDSMDYHTKAGRATGSVTQLKKKFRMVGAEIENRHELMNDSVLETIYKE